MPTYPKHPSIELFAEILTFIPSNFKYNNNLLKKTSENEDGNFIRKLVVTVSDEAAFHMNGKVNCRNNRVYGQLHHQPEGSSYDVNCYREKISVWGYELDSAGAGLSLVQSAMKEPSTENVIFTLLQTSLCLNFIGNIRRCFWKGLVDARRSTLLSVNYGERLPEGYFFQQSHCHGSQFVQWPPIDFLISLLISFFGATLKIKFSSLHHII